ncbi:Type IV pilus biogenesis factor PilY1 [Nymphon striatum]|nr:Type IV pilus biogenesis factor PilY1 [Nymphon striatum]
MMISLVLGLFLLGGLTSVYLGNKSTDKVRQEISKMEANARMALASISQGIAHAGYRSINIVPFETAFLTTSDGKPEDKNTTCKDNNDLLMSTTTHPFSADGIGVDSDQVTAVFLSDNPDDSINVKSRAKVFVDCSGGEITEACSTDADKGMPTPTDAKIYNSYFVNSEKRLVCLGSRNPDGVPITLADNIENMQIRYGVTMSNQTRYRTATEIDASGEWQSVTSVQIALLVSSDRSILDSDISEAFVLLDQSVSVNTLIAGNDQQQMILYQETETRLKQLTSIHRLSQTFTNTGFTSNDTADTQQYVFAESDKWQGFTESIQDMQASYPCEQGGKAMSLGPNMPVCDLYNFEVNAKKSNMGVKDIHHSGAGKMVPVISGLLVSALSLVHADDTELYFKATSGANPNVLFIMDNSGSMAEEVGGTASLGTVFTVKRYISTKSDDAEEFADSSVDLSSSDLEMINDGQDQKIGLRFANLNIPNSAVIEEAYIQFEVDEVSTDATNLTIQAQQHENPGTFISANNNISDRVLYGTAVSWNPPSWEYENTFGVEQRTPDLIPLVQPIVNGSGWGKGNAMVFVISGSGKRVAKSHEAHGGPGSPYLYIKYKSDDQNKTRMMVMKEALGTVLADAPDNLSVGLANYGDTLREWRKDNANGIKFPITAINELAKPIIDSSITVDGAPVWWKSNIPQPSDTATVRSFLSDITSDWQPNGMTPIVDALYEAALYYRGEQVFWGNDEANRIVKHAAHPATYSGAPIADNVDYESCDTTTIKEVWHDDIDLWRTGTSWGEKCPADRLNPVGPGTEANCAATEHNCITYDWFACNVEAEIIGCNATDEEGTCTDPIYAGGDWCAEYSSSKGRSCDYATCKYTELPAPDYKSPLTGTCQSNFIVLMSDGKPEYLAGTDDYPPTYNQLNTETAGMASVINSTCADAPSGFKSGRCGPELTRYLADNDNNLSLEGNQSINTYVIGFASGITTESEDYLKSLVTLEDDLGTSNKEGYFSAQNTEQLTAAFQQALTEITQEARSQAAPGYSVNTSDGLRHDDSIYIPVFDKNSGSRWSGNLKKFKLVDSGGKRYIRGKVTKAGNSDGTDYVDAVDELGFFTDQAWDEWSQSNGPDGGAVTKGGTASLLTQPESRKLYSNISGSKNLSDTANLITRNNSLITNEVLGLDESATEEYRKKILNFIRGWENGEYSLSDDDDDDDDESSTSNTSGKPRLHMGDMLHSEPTVITYNYGNGSDTQEQYIFAATNEGYLHAFDSQTGVEKFAFMPKSLLKNIQSKFTTVGQHLYGIDGAITFWHDDKDHDNIVNNEDKVYLYFGLRRGGRAYYALDITDVNSPKMMWEIDNTTQAAFSTVIFSGGNDETQDYGSGATYNKDEVKIDIPATMGNDIFIVNAKTGALIWSLQKSMGNTDVKHAIPGGVRILDVNRNQILDRMYFADTGGNVWRLDLSENLSVNSTDNTSKLVKMASLATADSIEARKFYNEPDVAKMTVDSKTVFSISVGSGLRPHPMNDVLTDHMFVLLDREPLQVLKDETFDTINISDLAKVTVTTSINAENPELTTKSVSNNFGDDKHIMQTDKRGWYVAFGDVGEKVLASSLTFRGSILFTTLAPEVGAESSLSNVCDVPSTQGRLYALDILTGKPTLDLDMDGDVDSSDVFKITSGPEIPGTPQPIFNELVCDDKHNCTHDVDIRIGKKRTQINSEDVADVEGTT